MNTEVKTLQDLVDVANILLEKNDSKIEELKNTSYSWRGHYLFKAKLSIELQVFIPENLKAAIHFGINYREPRLYLRYITAQRDFCGVKLYEENTKAYIIDTPNYATLPLSTRIDEIEHLAEVHETNVILSSSLFLSEMIDEIEDLNLNIFDTLMTMLSIKYEEKEVKSSPKVKKLLKKYNRFLHINYFVESIEAGNWLSGEELRKLKRYWNKN